jgi:hypothetical protein
MIIMYLVLMLLCVVYTLVKILFITFLTTIDRIQNTLMRREPDVIAVQEPWVSKQTKTIYCPGQGKYQRIYSTGRAALYIHKRHPPNT